MKLLLITILFLSFVSCSKDCEDQSKALLNQYNNSIKNANGNPDAIQDLRRQYEQAKANIDC